MPSRSVRTLSVKGIAATSRIARAVSHEVAFKARDRSDSRPYLGVRRKVPLSFQSAERQAWATDQLRANITRNAPSPERQEQRVVRRKAHATRRTPVRIDTTGTNNNHSANWRIGSCHS